MKPKNQRFDRAHRRTFVEILDRCVENGGDRAANLLLGLSLDEWKPLVQACVDASFGALHGSNGSYRKLLEVRLERGWTRAQVVIKAKGAFNELGLKRWEYHLDKASKPAPKVGAVLEEIFHPNTLPQLLERVTGP